MSNFMCAQCNRVLSYKEMEGLSVVGFVSRSGNRYCYDCWAKFEIFWMLESGKATLYFTEPWKNRWPGGKTACDFAAEVVNFPNTLRFATNDIKRSAYMFNGNKVYRVDVWFTGPDGAKWHGVNRGDNQILRCHRLKRQRKNLTPLKESSYLRPYNYVNNVNS